MIVSGPFCGFPVTELYFSTSPNTFLTLGARDFCAPATCRLEGECRTFRSKTSLSNLGRHQEKAPSQGHLDVGILQAFEKLGQGPSLRVQRLRTGKFEELSSSFLLRIQDSSDFE